MKKSKVIWMNNNFVNWDNGSPHFLSHALHYGTAVFEGIRAYQTKKGAAIFRLDDHINRLFNSAKIFGINIPYTKEEIINATIKTVKENNLEECYIRPLVYYSDGGLGFDVTNQKVDVGIAAWEWGAMLGKDKVENGMRIKISKYRRPSSEFMPVTAKVSGNYANSVMAKMDAINSGFDDAVMLDKFGNVAECSAENFFMIKDNTLFTPTKENCLEGITRATIMQIAKENNYKVEEKTISPSEIINADECFACGTAAEIVPITKIDNTVIGNGKPGTITRKIQEKYKKIITGENKKYHDWLAFVK